MGINVAVVLAGTNKASEDWQLANEPSAISRMVRKGSRLGGDEAVYCYEAGPCGYASQRQLKALGKQCVVVAPSLIPSKPGERVKTDRRDSRKLAELLKAGLLTAVHAPSPEEEAVRDLTRAREDAKKELLSARHRLSKMLLRHGYSYAAGTNWTLKHRDWLKGIRFDLRDLQAVLDNYILGIEQIEERLKDLNGRLEEVAQSARYAERVGWLRCLRGIDTLTAMVILSELHDPRGNGDRQSVAAGGVEEGLAGRG